MQNRVTTLFSSLLFVAATLLFIGCSGTSVAPSNKPKVIPAWVNALPPSDNDDYMYGMAIDVDRKSAIYSALNDMVAKLGTTIESSYESSQEVQGAYAKLTVNNKIKADISKVKINNYRVIKSHRLNYREFAVVVEVDKRKFVNGLKETLKQEKESISQEQKALVGRDIVTIYNTKKRLLKRAESLLPVIFIIAELDKKFNKKANLDFVLRAKKEFLNASKRLKFYVTGNRASTRFVDKIKNYLAQKGFRVVDSKRGALKINVKTTSRISRNGFAIAIFGIDISVYDKEMRIGGKNIIIKERYSGSLESAYKNASIDFEKEMKSKGINEVMGINLLL